MKLAGTVILYYPEEQVHRNINSYLPFLNLLIVIDNSEPNANDFLSAYANNQKVIIQRNKENEGIARPLNHAAAIAIKKGYDWLLTMDQDSSFAGNGLAHYIQCVGGLTNPEKVGVCGVNSIKKINAEIKCKPLNVSTIITSGTILNLKSYLHAGDFDERLFIDGVDDEYCFRLKQNGYHVIQFKNIFLNHRLGNEMKVRNFGLGKQVHRNVFSSIRLYYMVRNYHLILSEYGKAFPQQRKKYYLELFTKGKNAILYGPSFQTIGFIFKGYRDFLLRKFGKYR